MWDASRALDVVEKLWRKIGGARERALGVRACEPMGPGMRRRE